MAYQAIYRKWRPLVFEDIVGQNHVTRTLKNQTQGETIAHAYLFCGTRGTGKTTAAKIFARAVNCENPKDGSPCNECPTCKGILNGSILDVSEIDAASNNGVDNIREIREDVNYVATNAKYRVYIIDEVHMLSSGAFNALLKTLEEPPPHVIFILATTEAHRVPETILSRCQRFDFKRIRPDDIIVRMKEIATHDGLKITDDAYNLIARFADGSMRDALSILERCVSECGSELSLEKVVSALGASPSGILFASVEAIEKKDTKSVLEIVEELSSEGKDLNVYADSLIKQLRDLMVCKVADTPENLLERTAEEYQKLKSQAQKISFEEISFAISELTKARADAKWVKNPRTIYELALIRLTQPELNNSTEALLARIQQLEEQIKEGVVKVVSVEEKKENKLPEKQKEKKEVSARLYVPLDISTLSSRSPIVAAARKWEKVAQIIAKKAPFVAGALHNRKITIDGEGIILVFAKNEQMLKKIASTYIKTIRAEFLKNTGGDFVFKTAFEEDVEDYMVDYWSLSDDGDEQEENFSANEKNKDPLEILSQKFPEIIEMTDESDFVNYQPEEFLQTELGESDEREEFLDEQEMKSATDEE